MVETMTPRRFPAPWTAEKIAGGYVETANIVLREGGGDRLISLVNFQRECFPLISFGAHSPWSQACRDIVLWPPSPHPPAPQAFTCTAGLTAGAFSYTGR
jgi:hypothetical protein